MPRILIVEDDRDISRLVRHNLEREGLVVEECSDGLRALAQIKRSTPDLVVLDLMLPGMSGFDICRQMRRQEYLDKQPAILMLTARTEEADRVMGFELGADDYVIKPFSVRELVARVKALLRRTAPPPTPAANHKLSIGKLELDPSSYRVTRAGALLNLSVLEFRLLHFLAAHPNHVYSREQLLEQVWGTDRVVGPRIVDVYVRHLRQKIESDPENPTYLKTVRGAGYLFEAPRQR